MHVPGDAFSQAQDLALDNVSLAKGDSPANVLYRTYLAS